MTERHETSDVDDDEREFLREFSPQIAETQARYSQCPGLDAIKAADAGALSETATATVREHLARCGWCSALAADLALSDRSTLSRDAERRIRARVFAGGPPAERQWLRSWKVLVPLAAAAGVILATVLVQDGGRLAPRSGGASSSGIDATRREGGQTSGTPQALTVLRLEKPAVRLPLAAAVTWRGEPDRDRSRFADEFKAAMSSYRADDYAAATDRLGGMAREFAASPDVWFYLGVSQLLLGSNREAIASLGTARRLTNSERVHEISWYLAIAHQRTGHIEAALEVLGDLCRGRNPYSAQACAGMQELKARGTDKGGR